MKLRIGICDDEPENLQLLQQYLERYEMCYDIEFDAEYFTNGDQLLKHHLEIPYHVILLDIELPEKNGIEIARQLRDLEPDDVFIIFVTSYPEYMLDSFEVQPFQFLVKPTSYSDVEKLFQNIQCRYEKSHTTKIIIDTQNEKRFVNMHDLLYIKAIKGKKSYLKYVLTTEEFIGQGTIQNWEAILEDFSFISPYRGYLINVNYIVSYDNTKVQLTDGAKIPISRRKLKDFQQTYANQIIEIMH